jgi:NAD(P)-dependent dehydrogenase (short-subunit alcohol dehydrogenase family)
MNIKNKVVIVTGASEGIGRATAKVLSEKGAKVVVAARSKEKLEDLVKELGFSMSLNNSGMDSPTRPFVVVTDMTKLDSIKNLIRETKKKFGRIDVLINNAGQGMYSDLEHIDVDNYRKIIELNVIGPLIAMQEVIPIMREQAQKAGVDGAGATKGKNIDENKMTGDISSMVSKNYYPNLSAYASTKYALNALTLTARAELAKDGIVVELVHPGMTTTDFGKNSIRNNSGEHLIPRRREGMPTPDSAEFVANRIASAIESGEPETYMHPGK